MEQKGLQVCFVLFVTSHNSLLKSLSVRVLDDGNDTFVLNCALMSASKESLIVFVFKEFVVCFVKVTASKSSLGLRR